MFQCKSIVASNRSNYNTSGDITNYLLNCGSYITIRKYINNEFRITVGSRLPGKNAGDTWQERSLELLAGKLELERQRLEVELIEKNFELRKLRYKYQKKADPALWDKIAVLELETRELEYLTTGKDFDLFQVSRDDNLGITKKLQAITQAKRISNPKNDFTSPRKPNKLSTNAKHKIIENCTVMDRLYGDNQYLITLTVPGNTQEIKKAIADYSPYIDNSLYQVIRDLRKRQGYEIDYVGVWEHHKSGKLHKHIVIGSNDLDNQQLRIVSKAIGDQWERILDNMGTGKYIKRGNYSGCLPVIDMYQRSADDIKKTYSNISSWKDHKDTLREIENKDGGKVFVNIQRVRKSVARYLAKYLSKSQGKLSKKDQVFNPVRWWQSSQNLKNIAKDYRLECTVSKSLDNILLLDDLLKFLEKSGAITLSYKNEWDIYAVIDKESGKSKRVNIKPGQPIPANSRRVSNGVQFILYYDQDQFTVINKLLGNVIKELSKKKDTILENKPAITVKPNQEKLTGFDYRNWTKKHKEYWLNIIENSA